MITCEDFMNDKEFITNEALLKLNNKIENMAHTDWIEINRDEAIENAYSIKEVKFIIPIKDYNDMITISICRSDNNKKVLPSIYTNLNHIITTIENTSKDKIWYDGNNCYLIVPYYFFQFENCAYCSIYTCSEKIKIFIKRYECNKQPKFCSYWYFAHYIVKGVFQFDGYILGVFIQTTKNDRSCNNNSYEDDKYKVVLRHNNIEKEILLNKINKTNKFGIYTYFLNLNVLSYKQAVNPKNYKHYYKNKEHLIKWTKLSIRFTSYCTINKIDIII